MTKEQALLLELLAHNITGADISGDTENIDWISLIKESVAQTVSVVAFDSVTPIKDKIPEDIYKKWFNHSCSAIAVNSFVEKSQKELIEHLSKDGYDYLILKGLSAASYYNKPELRLLGDVDFLINPKEKENIKALLENEGYTASHEDHICHIVFNKPKAHLEMHFEIAGMPKNEKAEVVRAFMNDALAATRTVNFGENCFNAPSNKHHAVILLLHMQHHLLGEGIGLRHLMDWACFVHKTAEEPFWKEELIPFLKKAGLWFFANSMTDLCVRYLKLTAPDWLVTAKDDIAESVIEDILSGGNFGKKEKLRDGLAMGMAKNKKGRLKSAFHTLKFSTPDVYPVVKKYKILYPFIYFYRILRYAFLVLIGKRVSLTKSLPYAEERHNLYNKLHIYEVTEDE